MKKFRRHALVAICVLGLGCRTQTPMPIEARSDSSEPISIAVVPFGVAPGGSAPPVDVAQVISADLAASGRFAPMEAAEMPSRPTDLADVRFEEWHRVETDYLVVGLVARVHDGGHEVEFRLIDTRTRQELVGFLVPSAPDELHRTAREIAGLIQQRLAGDGTGKRSTRVASAPAAPTGSTGVDGLRSVSSR